MQHEKQHDQRDQELDCLSWFRFGKYVMQNVSDQSFTQKIRPWGYYGMNLKVRTVVRLLFCSKVIVIKKVQLKIHIHKMKSQSLFLSNKLKSPFITKSKSSKIQSKLFSQNYLNLNLININQTFEQNNITSQHSNKLFKSSSFSQPQQMQSDNFSQQNEQYQQNQSYGEEQDQEEQGSYMEQMQQSQHSEYSQQQSQKSGNKSDSQGSQHSESQYSDRELQIRRWQWAYPIIQGVSPCPRGGHSATLSGASIIIFGGHYFTGKTEGYAYLNDTYILDVNANKFTKPKISGTPPAPRYAHSAVLAGSKIIIFGGRGAKGKIFRDLHALDPVTMTWLQGPQGIGSPSARYGHSAVLVAQTKIFIFGGTNGKEYFNDLYVLDLEVMAWSQPKCEGPLPSPRHGHTAIQVGTNMIIQGGFNFDEDAQKQAGFRQGTQLQSCYLNDIRILDTEKYEWARVRVSGSPPLPRYGHTANISGPDIIFFGGWSINSGARGQQNFIPPADIDYFIVLNTDNQLVWEKGKFQGQPPLSRYGHSATSIGPHILIFGGWEFNRATNQVVVLRDMNATSKKK